MSEFSHASIVPLIGGETIGSEQAYGERPTHFMSYEAFAANDSHVRNHYPDVPYYVLDKGEVPTERADVVSSVCPCAGLSMMSMGYGDDNPNNEWMKKTARYILGDYKPKVFWGENAPGFAGKIGKNVREELRQVGRDNGYTMSVYRTRSLLHGIPQVRERSFYFFWKDTKVPLLGYYNKPYTPIETLLTSIKSNFQTEVICNKTPSHNPYYRYVLEVIEGGITHVEFAAKIDGASARNNDVFGYIERMGHNYKQVAKWFSENGLEKEVEKAERKYEKLKAGGSIMRRGVIVPKDYIGAFVGHYPLMLAHPEQDRFINYREAMTIMGLPDDFELVNASPRNVNHICQNVPVQTARDMATEVKKYLENKQIMVDTDYIVQYNGTMKEEYVSKESTLDAFFV